MSHLKSLREQARLTQIALHMATGIDQSLLSKYERGERLPSSPDLLRLADHYQTSVDFILERTDERKPYPPKKK